MYCLYRAISIGVTAECHDDVSDAAADNNCSIRVRQVFLNVAKIRHFLNKFIETVQYILAINLFLHTFTSNSQLINPDSEHLSL